MPADRHNTSKSNCAWLCPQAESGNGFLGLQGQRHNNLQWPKEQQAGLQPTELGDVHHAETSVLQENLQASRSLVVCQLGARWL